MKTLKVLVSAYACRPGEGSEPAIGWNVVKELVKYHKVWVLTRENNRPGIEAELSANPIPGLHFVYCEPPAWVQRLNRGQRVVQLHYYLWQIVAYFTAKKLHQQVQFDVIHHVTYVKYWGPSFLALLPVPFIWGPVGGGESMPKAFMEDIGLRGRVYETLRTLACWFSERDPSVRLTARRSRLAWATTEDTAKRLHQIGAVNVVVLPQIALSSEEIEKLATLALAERRSVKLLSVGRLLHWKGFHLGLQAFAQADLPKEAQYWIVGDGPERARLQTLAENLGISQQVYFWGKLSREETLEKLGECLALIHPSLHESGGLACLEAMASGCPVLCLDLGGPAILVTPETGFKIAADTPNQAVKGLAAAITRLAKDSALYRQMKQAGQKRVRNDYSWKRKVQLYAQHYAEL